MRRTVRNIRNHIIYKTSDCLDIDVVSDKQFEMLKKIGKITWKNEISKYIKDEHGFSNVVYQKKFFYKK